MTHWKTLAFSSFAFLCLSTENSFAHPYFPLVEGSRSVMDYSFSVETDRKEFAQANTKGSLECVAKGWEERKGVKYLHFVTTYKDIPFMKESASLWRHEKDGILYLAQLKDEQVSETVELPADVTVGVEWPYDDGAKSIRKVTANTEVTLVDGEKLRDCIEVTRRVIHNEALKDFNDRTYYCRDRGDVRTLIIQPSPVGDYRTETIERSAPGR